MARLLGFRVFEIRLGAGFRLRTWRFGHTEVTAYGLPISAYMIAGSPTLRRFRLRWFCIIMAGPVATLILATIAFVLRPRPLGLRGGWWFGVDNFSVILMFIAGLWTLCTALPFRTIFHRKPPRFPEPGQLKSPFLHGEERTLSRAEFQLDHSFELYQEGHKDRAVRWMRRALRHPTLSKDANMRFAYASLLAETNDIDGACAEYFQIIESRGFDPASTQWRILCDIFSSMVIYHDRSHMLEKARAVITSVSDAFPEAITLQGTLGSILYACGERAKAKAILNQVLSTSQNPLDQAISGAYLARIAADENNLPLARELAEKALDQIPEGAPGKLVRRLTDGIAHQPTGTS